MSMTSFYTSEELKTIGLGGYGNNVLISRYARIYGASNIFIENNVRIDDFCVLSISKELKIGNYVHIGCGSSIIGGGSVIISDFCGISGRVSIYSSCDDFSGNYLTNPMVDEQFTSVMHAPVILEKHVIIGCGSVLMPGIRLEEGVAIGAMSFVTQNCKGGFIYCGNPLKRLIPRSTKYKELETKFLNSK